MIARLYLALPFHLAVPEATEFALWAYEDEGCRVVIHPPIRTDKPARGDPPETVTIDSKPAVVCNGLQIDFHKQAFDRAANGNLWDPPLTIISRAVASFITRLRIVARAHHTAVPDLLQSTWRLVYLNDDGSDLQPDPDLVRAKAARAFEMNVVALSTEVWEGIHSLPPDYEPPVWSTLSLDARAALPDIGVAIVLASSSLEVFIGTTLGALASALNRDSELWSWVNNRRDWLKAPSVEEQFDSLLKLMTGHSLKEEPGLWQSFRNLRTARNNFVHGGRAEVGGTPLSLSQAQELVQNADKAIAWIRQWLPEDLRWPEFILSTKVSMTKVLLGPSQAND